MNNIIILLIASIFEVLWVIFLKYSNGFTNHMYSFLTIITAIASFIFLSMVIKNIQLGIVYSIWTGIGIIGTTIFGVLIFGDKITFIQILFIILIIIGILGLYLY